MSVPAVPSPTCEVTWMENGIIVSDGKEAVVTAYFHPSNIDNMVPMVSMCDDHYQLLSPRELSSGVWSFNVIADLNPTMAINDPNIQAPPKLILETE